MSHEEQPPANLTNSGSTALRRRPTNGFHGRSSERRKKKEEEEVEENRENREEEEEREKGKSKNWLFYFLSFII